MLSYVDVSKYQGDIDFKTLKNEVNGVIIRAGYGLNNIDPYFERNIKGCNDNGIPCGVYWFSYALTADEAAKEAAYCLAAIKPYKIELPVCFDFEGDSVRYAKNNGVTVTKKLASDIVRAFCNAIEIAGYYAMNYANEDYCNRYFDNDVLSRFSLWYARYMSNPDLNTRPRKCGIWQYSSNAKVKGINGNVDINIAYIDFKKVIAGAGLNNLMDSAKEETKEETKKETDEDSGNWYAAAQAWAINKGITDGSRPTEAATRAEVWSMLYRLMNGGA